MSSRTQKEPGSALDAGEDRLPKVEKYLESTFKPIAPRADFVKDLRSRLQDPHYLERPQNSNLVFFFMIGTAAAMTALIVAGMIRLAGEVAGAVNLLRLNTRHRQQRI